MRRALVTATLAALAALATAGAAKAAAPPLQAFFTKLDRLAATHAPVGAAAAEDRAKLPSGSADSPRGPLYARIAWWGDSAIVADGYTGAVRARLQARFGDGGPGLVQLMPPFDGYLHKRARLKRHGWETWSVLTGGLKTGRYGYAGVVAQSFGGASTTFTARDDLGGAVQPFEVVELLYRGTPKGGLMQIFAGSDAAPAYSKRATADPSTDLAWRVPLSTPAAEVKIRAGGGGLTRLYGVVFESKAGGVVLDTMGILGVRARRWLRQDPKHFARQVSLRRPDLLVFNFGGNERVDPALTAASHAQELVDLIQRARAGAPEASCLIIGPHPHGVWVKRKLVLDPKLDKIYAGQRQAAQTTGCAFLDTVALMGGGDAAMAEMKARRWIGADLSHLTPAGHREVGRRMADWLLGTYDLWHTAKQAAAAAAAKPASPGDGAGEVDGGAAEPAPHAAAPSGPDATP